MCHLLRYEENGILFAFILHHSIMTFLLTAKLTFKAGRRAHDCGSEVCLLVSSGDTNTDCAYRHVLYLCLQTCTVPVLHCFPMNLLEVCSNMCIYIIYAATCLKMIILSKTIFCILAVVAGAVPDCENSLKTFFIHLNVALCIKNVTCLSSDPGLL